MNAGGPSPLELLTARTGAVPYVDFDEMVARLVSWCEADAPRLQVSILVGEGGMGKSRAAFELCRRLSRRAWTCGIYEPGQKQQDINLATLDSKRLIVVDDAAARASKVDDLLTIFASTPVPKSVAVRIVLLVRGATESHAKSQFSFRDSDARALIDRASVVVLSDPRSRNRLNWSTSARNAIYSKARVAFGRSEGAFAVPDLTGDTFSAPLFVVARALLDTYQANEDFAPVTESSILDRLLDREQETHWNLETTLPTVRCPEADWSLQRRLVATSSMFIFATRQELVQGIRALNLYPSPADLERIATWLSSLYPGENVANSLEPDLLRERLLERCLESGWRPNWRTMLLGEMGPQSIRRAIDVVTRVFERSDSWRAYFLEELEPLLDELFRAALAEEELRQGDGAYLADSLNLFVQATELVPDLPSIGLVGPASTRLIIAALEVYLARNDGLRFEYLSRLAFYTRNNGDTERALAAIREALSLYDDSDTRRSSEAQVLGQLHGEESNCLAAHGDRAAALVSSRKAVAYLDRARRSRDVEDFDWNAYGAAWTSYANRLTDNADHADAFVASRRGVAARRLSRIAQDSLESRLALANALNTYSNSLAKLGQLGRAVTRATEAVHIAETLPSTAATKRYLANFYLTLSNRKYQLFRATGDNSLPAEFVRHAQDSELIRRELAANHNGSAFVSDLCISLNNLNVYLPLIGDTVGATRAIKEVIDLTRPLARTNPLRFSFSLSRALLNYAEDVQEAEPDLGIELLRQCVELRRTLFENNVRSFGRELLASLKGLSGLLAQLGRPDPSVETEISELSERLAIEYSDDFLGS